jgi:hypothetical protein
VSREVVSREAAPRLGSLTVQNQISPRLGFCVGGGTPFIPGTLVVSAYVIQPIPKISFMVSVDVIQPIAIIFCIGWLTSTDTNKARPINTAHTPLFRPSTKWRWLLFRPRLFPFFEVFFQLSLICVFPFFAMVYIDLDFNFTMISLMDLGLFPYIYSKRYRIILMYIF